MTKTILGIAAALGLTTSAATAADQKPQPKVATASVQERQGRTPAAAKRTASPAAKPAAEKARAEVVGVRDFDQKAWLEEREGYRDGGY